MPRIVLGLEYLGTAYCGWQKQNACVGVQEKLEQALAKIACEPVEVFCAGRTDRGVHALAQVVHFDTRAQRPTDAWVRGTNTHLPADIRVLWQSEADEAFHARFSAIARRYRYVIVNRPVRPALFHAHQCHFPYALDAERMHLAAQALVGEQDFTTFRAAECQAKHPIRTVHWVEVKREGEFIFVDIQANGFLHHMVRNIVGSLLKIGTGERPVDWLSELIAAKDRKRAAATAPANGLYFTGVSYPEPYVFASASLASLWRE